MDARRVVALVLACSLLAAARGEANPRKAEAKRHLIVSTVALEEARLGVQGLYALIDDDSGAFDVVHAATLIGMAERDLSTAAAHLQRLTTVPAKDKDAPTNLTRALTGIARVQLLLKSIEASIKGGRPANGSGGDVATDPVKDLPPKRADDPKEALKKRIRETWKALDEAMGDHHKVADDHGVSTRLPTP
jgi:hypothetical protein